MTPAELVPLALKASVFVLVFTIGLGTTPSELAEAIRRPRKLLKSLFAMNIVMPIVALAIVALFELRRPTEIMLIALALAPVPPLLPKKMVRAGGGHAYVMALLFAASLFAIISIPIAGRVLNIIAPVEISIPTGMIAKLIVLTVLAPTVVGMVFNLAAPKIARKIEGPLGGVATILVLLAGLLIAIKVGPTIAIQFGDGTLAALAAFVLIGLAVGHLIGGPEPRDRSVLALATATRHPGIAMAIASLTFPAETALLTTVLLYLVMGIVLGLPYVIWRRHTLSGGPDAGTQADQSR